jgi:hypothetical protein
MPVPPVPVAANPHEYWLFLAQAFEKAACDTRATCARGKGQGARGKGQGAFFAPDPAKVGTHCVP